MRSPPYERLTSRELQVLTALADGLTNQQIAHRLGISIRTINVHQENIYRKLNVHSRIEAVAVFAQMWEVAL